MAGRKIHTHPACEEKRVTVHGGPRPSAYTRRTETHVCRHWAAATTGVQAMVFLGAGIGVFAVAALVFLGAGIGVFSVAARSAIPRAGTTSSPSRPQTQVRKN